MKSAIECYKIADSYLQNKAYEKAISWYNKAIALDETNPRIWNNKGIVSFFLEKYNEAIDYYEQAILLDNSNPHCWNNKGMALISLGRHEMEAGNYRYYMDHHSLETVNKKCLPGFFKRFEDAITCFDRALNISSANNSSNFNSYSQKAAALCFMQKNKEAIPVFKQALLLNEKNAYCWKNKGNAWYSLKEYPKAFSCYNKARKLDPEDRDVYGNIGSVFAVLGKYRKAACCFERAQKDILSILGGFPENEQAAVGVAREMLGLEINKKESFISQTLKTVEDPKIKEEYLEIYQLSLEIIALLQVNQPGETHLAHYTSKPSANALLFHRSLFRLGLITASNDPKEGLTLLDHLFSESAEHSFQNPDEAYRAFAACFLLNHDSLNQFRLYGKEDGCEATGLSLVVKNSFFSQELIRSTPSPLLMTSIFGNKEIEPEMSNEEKLPLFRCIYLDPDTGEVASIGHREAYTFYRAGEDHLMNTYYKYIEDTLEKVRQKMEELTTRIHDSKRDPDIISRLLLNLRYLTKHVAFKEEQECRIIRIERIDNRSLVQKKDDRFFIEYLPLVDHMHKIYFGPKALGMELYRDLLHHEGLVHIKCRRSTQPFA